MSRTRDSRIGLGFIALIFLLGACSSGPDRDDEGAIVETGSLDAFSIKEGDCLESPSEDSEFSSVQAVPCTDPHDMEAYYLFDLPDGTIPSEQEMGEFAATACIEAFEGYVGVDYPSSRYEISWFTPTAASWDQGDQEIVCLVVDGGTAKLTESVKGSQL